MCDPVSISMAVLSVATTAYSVHEQNTAQNFQEAAAKVEADRQNTAAAENARLQARQLNLQQSQEQEAAGQQKMQQQMAVQKEVATQRVAAGESGVSGLSIDSIFADIVRQGSNNMTTLDRNLADSNQQRDVERGVIQNNQWASIQQPQFYKSKNAGMGAALQIAGAGISGATAGMALSGQLKDAGYMKSSKATK